MSESAGYGYTCSPSFAAVFSVRGCGVWRGCARSLSANYVHTPIRLYQLSPCCGLRTRRCDSLYDGRRLGLLDTAVGAFSPWWLLHCTIVLIWMYDAAGSGTAVSALSAGCVHTPLCIRRAVLLDTAVSALALPFVAVELYHCAV